MSASRHFDIREIHDAAFASVALAARRAVNRLRMRLASLIMGRGWLGTIQRLVLIRDRAMRAVNRDGAVTLFECEALAQALYEDVPGEWLLTVALIESIPDDGSDEGAET